MDRLREPARGPVARDNARRDVHCAADQCDPSDLKLASQEDSENDTRRAGQKDEHEHDSKGYCGTAGRKPVDCHADQSAAKSGVRNPFAALRDSKIETLSDAKIE